MRWLLTAIALVLLAAAPAGPAAAADEAASRSLTIGVDAYRQGSLEAAVEALSEALSSRQAAKAFYYRGLAYRALGRPAQAVADLEAAIAQRNGLSLSQLADAQDQRDAARGESNAPAAIATPPPMIASHPQEPSPIETQSHSQGFFTTTSIDASEPALSAWAASTTVPQAPPAFATQVLPSAVQPVAAPPMRTAAVQPTAATPLLSAQAPAASGSILVQVARVQTKNEAYALVVRLISQHGAEFDPSMLKIVQGVAENKPPVYLVRLGPFATADEAQKRCSALRKSGYDCVVQY
jgi:tetratricopeptide (TPR) repeat protein